MIPLGYLALRLARKLIPSAMMRLLLKIGVGIMPGLETRDPKSAANSYLAVLARRGLTIADRRVMVFGYGGSLGLGLELLRSGAAHVVLLDPYTSPNLDDQWSALGSGERFLILEDGHLSPNPEYLSIISEPIERYAVAAKPVDLVVSWSVFEHLRDPDGVVQQLARITAPLGTQLHHIDLRDHFFRYPFEMLCHSSQVWARFLNPPTNLNRLRLPDYENIFRGSFERVELEIIQSDEAAFLRSRPRIRPEFLSGELKMDAATRVRVWVQSPRSD